MAASGPTEQPARPPWIPEQLYPFESQFAQIDGARLHYVDEGSGPPLLLLHGNPTWSLLYREIIKLGCRQRTPDRGSGRTPPAPRRVDQF
jgi:haloalkane dehalogenase